MRTLILQSAVTLSTLLFGLIALAVARYQGAHGPGREQTWRITGFAFVMYGLNKAVQEVLGGRAYFAGAGTAAYDFYLTWAPAFNHSRTTAAICLWVVLGVVVVLRRPLGAGEQMLALSVLPVGMLLGAAIGMGEGSFQEAVHYSAVAVLDTVELVLLLSVLFGMLVRDSVDRMLWLTLAVYGLKLGLNAIWSSALMTIAIPQLWSPAPWQMHTYRVALNALMVLIAIRRLSLARRGVGVPSLFEPAQTRVPAVLH